MKWTQREQDAYNMSNYAREQHCLVDFVSNHQKAVASMVSKYNVQIEDLTEKQVAEAIKQAIEAGDFQIQIVAGDPSGMHRQCVLYIPGRGNDELRAANERLKEALRKIEELENCPKHAEEIVREALHGPTIEEGE